MDNISLLTSFFGWCSVINISVLLFSTLVIAFSGNRVKKIHARMFNLPEEQLDLMYFKYLAYYKIGILLFNLVPYIALKLME